MILQDLAVGAVLHRLVLVFIVDNWKYSVWKNTHKLLLAESADGLWLWGLLWGSVRVDGDTSTGGLGGLLLTGSAVFL